MKETWHERSRRIIAAQLAEWSSLSGKHWHDESLTGFEKEALIKYLSSKYPYAYRRGEAYKGWREIIKELKISIGLLERKVKAKAPKIPENPNQLTLF